MQVDRPPEIEPDREERVRALGFDPRFLTPEEQTELIEIHSVWPDEALRGGVMEIGYQLS